MKSFPPDIQFRLPWRDYQARVLEELQQHLDDNHLHVVAAPGSGKTVLGLEVVRRLKRPALILAPTIAIRDQWLDRFTTLFCPREADTTGWISHDLHVPKLLTVSTYQGLHSAYTGASDEEAEEQAEEEEDAAAELAPPRGRSSRKRLLQNLKQARIATLVVDEAHHLRSEWWKCLINVKKHLDGCVVVALTATPPLDVAPSEWQRYIDLCGPVDAEISVPELVNRGNLCPHQDYVYFSTPLAEEKARLAEFRGEVAAILKRLYASPQFTRLLLHHPCVTRPDEHIEQILEDPSFFSAIAVYLNHVAGRAPRRLTHIIAGRTRLPRLNLEWMEILLSGCLYEHRQAFQTDDAFLDTLTDDLKRIGAIERRQILLRHTAAMTRLLVSSLSKLRSIAAIVRLENDALSSNLRMVILTDFIRRADLPRSPDDLKPLVRIGVIPIFETLRRDLPPGARLGILSGSIVVVPRQAVGLMRNTAADMGIDAANLRCAPLRHDDTYCTVDAVGRDRQQIVRLITRLFDAGGITVLVGTRSLLGEGWDAPAINSLILASFVGAYMLSNQMRGRAIRTEHGNPDKTANVWHLVCTETNQADAGEDLLMLTRRFKSFLGVSFKGPVIENGIDRLDIGDPPFTDKRIEQLNARMIAHALDRNGLRLRWQQALAEGQTRTVVEKVAAAPEALPRRFVCYGAVGALLWQALVWCLVTFLLAARLAWPRGEVHLRLLLLTLAIACAAGSLAALPSCLRALWLLLRHRSIRSSMKQVARTVLRSCANAGLIQTPLGKLKVRTARLPNGGVACSLAGATMHEKSLFLEALQELLGQIENPRYLLIRKSRPSRWTQRSFNAVPTVLGRNRQTADDLLALWRKYVGPADLVYTRTPEGRRTLLKARAAAMSARLQPATRLKSWN